MIYTPKQKENQRKVSEAIRSGKYALSTIELWPGRNDGMMPEDNKRCFLGVGASEVVVYAKDRTRSPHAAHADVLYCDFESFFGVGRKIRDKITSFNDRKAKTLDDVLDYVVREYGWTDVKK